jgi:hypothetical protein
VHAKNLRPPAKWSYRKLAAWFSLAWLATLLCYVELIAGRSELASSLLMAMLVAGSGCLLVLLLGLVWRHNRLVYPREYDDWNQSFLCPRCGIVWVGSASQQS